jgi:hypothetical protein
MNTHLRTHLLTHTHTCIHTYAHTCSHIHTRAPVGGDADIPPPNRLCCGRAAGGRAPKAPTAGGVGALPAVRSHKHVLCTNVCCAHICVVYKYVMCTNMCCVQICDVYKYVLRTNMCCVQICDAYKYVMRTNMWCVQMCAVYTNKVYECPTSISHKNSTHIRCTNVVRPLCTLYTSVAHTHTNTHVLHTPWTIINPCM